MSIRLTTVAILVATICVSERHAIAGYLVDFEDINLAGQQYQFSPALNGISIETTSPWGATYAVSRKRILENVNTYWSNGDDTAVAGGGANDSQQWLAALNQNPGDMIFVAPASSVISSVDINNTFLVDYAVRNGLFQARAFQANDFLRARFLGMDSSNQLTGQFTQWIDLANYEKSLFVLTQWTTVNLLQLNSNRIAVEIEGSDNHPKFGLNTPAYLAFDNFQLTGIPEPTSLWLVTVVGLFCVSRSARSRQP